jgi:hypothetical protein
LAQGRRQARRLAGVGVPALEFQRRYLRPPGTLSSRPALAAR